MAPNYNCKQLQIIEQIGSGSFGKVYKAILNRRCVAVKIHGSSQNSESVKEINRMKWLDHPNVVTLLGVVPPNNHGRRCECDDENYNRDSSWIIMDYVSKGNLGSYVSSHPVGVSAYGMVKIAYQVACGMWYLHSEANKVHMDLSARNVLVKDDEYNVKIGDFGVLCDYEYNDDYYYHDDSGNACPVRWMPPENFPEPGERASYTRKGDVWSFGVLLFEIWSRGKVPFMNLNNEQVMDVVRNGETVLDYHHLKARAWVIELMKECFEFNKCDRPNFRKISKTILNNSDWAL